MKTTGKTSGFTLIELMITVAIVGILAAIAYPSYTAQVQKSRRADAQIALLEITQRQESYFLRNSRYGSLSEIGYSTASPDGYYTLSVTLNTDKSEFTAQASATSGKVQAYDTACKLFSIDQRGTKRGGKDADALAADTAQTCWK